MSLKAVSGILAFFIMLVSPAIAQKSSGEILKKMRQGDGVLYFLVPEKFKGANAKAAIVPDFTYFYQPGNPAGDSVSMNFFLITRIEPGNRLTLDIKIQGKEPYTAHAIELLYLEKIKKNWKNRLSVKIPSRVFFQMLESAGSVEIVISSASGEMIFRPGKKWKKMAAIAARLLEAETDINR